MGGDSVYYMKASEAADNKTEYDTLYRWNYSNNKSAKTAGAVVLRSPESNLHSGENMGDGFTYAKHNFKSTRGSVFTDLYHYNGKTGKRIAEDLIR